MKVNVTVSIDEANLVWVSNQVEEGTFKDRSHVFNIAIGYLRSLKNFKEAVEDFENNEKMEKWKG